MIAPFVVLGLPRSRTAWLSKFLTYGRWTCGHEELRHMRALDDVKAWLSIPYVGTAETAAAPFWRLLVKYRPDVRIVVVRRSVRDVVESLMAIDTQDAGVFDRHKLTALMRRLDAKLDQIEARAPNVLTVAFGDLSSPATAKAVFEHCLPYPFDPEWLSRLAPVNVQCNFPALMRHANAFGPQLAKLAALAKQEMLRDLAKRPSILPEGVTLQTETLASWRRDGKDLFAEHAAQVGEAPWSPDEKNWAVMAALEQVGAMQIVTARSNGRMFGYLMTVISPSLESVRTKVGVHTAFYGSKDIPGLGLKMQRAALPWLRERGIDEVVYRAGPRGSGPKMESLYRRLGAEPYGELFRLNLKD